MLDKALSIKQNITMRDIATKYGFKINSCGFIPCPFHGEKTASLKIYPGKKGWHCFGCGEGRSVIDFVMKLYSLRFSEACHKISDDFNLHLYDEKMSKEKVNIVIMQRQRDRLRAERKQSQITAEWLFCSKQYRKVNYLASIADCCKNLDDISPAVAEAIKELSTAEYLLDEAEKDLILLEKGETNEIE